MVFISACMGTKFTYMTDERLNKIGKPVTVSLKPDYLLYKRQVIKVYDATTRTYLPANGALQTDDQKELIEVEYLFLSEKLGKALVINNIPNKNKVFYNNPESIVPALAKQQEQINVWFFSQFRFADIESGPALRFKNIEGSGKDHVWGLERNGDTIKVVSVATVDNAGADIRYVAPAFSIEMIFVKEPFYELRFSYSNGEDRCDFPVTNQAIHLYRNKKESWTAFSFDTTVYRHFRNVAFPNERMYAGPVQINR